MFETRESELRIFQTIVCLYLHQMLCRFSSLPHDYLRERREERSRYVQRKKARYMSARKSRHFAHMDYAVSHRVGTYISVDAKQCLIQAMQSIFIVCD